MSSIPGGLRSAAAGVTVMVRILWSQLKAWCGGGGGVARYR
ncbi:hypothetical protein EBESD8_11210 [Rhodococcus aetherivorans]|nr:hypothetical protein EBESD8_11210 [Rhodococcus aetherivorans]